MTRILLVDDDPLLRVVIVMTLETAGYQVVEANEGSEALSILAQDPAISLVLSDINMPGMDGPTFLNKAQACYPSLPILMLSVNSPWSWKPQMQAAGARGYLPKPFTTQELLRSVQSALGEEITGDSSTRGMHNSSGATPQMAL
jgi:two-component system, chemotaxis family, chemotaxis protein CheY